MKLNKKFVAINVLATLLFTDIAMARVGVVRTSRGEDSSSGSSTSTDGQVKKSVVSDVSTGTMSEGARVQQCDYNTEKEIYYPMELISDLARDEGSKVNFSFKGDNTVVVKIPPVASICGNFVPFLKQDKETRNLTVLMAIKKENPETKKVENITYAEFEKCIKDSGKTTDGNLDHGKLVGKDYASSVYELNYSFNKAKDSQKSIAIGYGSPTSFYADDGSGYKTTFDLEEKIKSVPDMKCMNVEKIAKGPTTYAHRGPEAIIEEINEICKSGDAQAIADARNRLGNANLLQKLAEQIMTELDAGYLQAVKKDVAQIYKDLDGIEAKIVKNKDEMSEEMAKKLSTEYANKAKELDAKFMNQAIQRMDLLMQKRDKLEEESAEIKVLDQEVKGLAEEIGKFFNRKDGLRNAFEIMEKFALTDLGKTVYDIELKSQLYAQVGAGGKGKKAYTFEKAHKDQVSKMKKFENVASEWTDVYQAGKGNEAPLIRTQKEAQAVATRMNSRLASFQKKEMEDYNNYCTSNIIGTMKNQSRCKEFMNGKAKREKAQLQKREKDLNYIAGKQRKLNKMSGGFIDYQNRKMASVERDEDDRFGGDSSSMTGYEDSFEDRFPNYSGNISTAYDPSMFNMGGNNMMMNGGGQQQMMYQQPQQQMMPGYQQPMMNTQYQNMGGGAWPAMQ